MSETEKLAAIAIGKVEAAINDLKAIRLDDYDAFSDRLGRWRDRVVLDLETISAREAKRFEATQFNQRFAVNDFNYTHSDLMFDQASFYLGKLEVLYEELKTRPDHILDPNLLPKIDAWDFYFKIMHPKVVLIAKSRFAAGQYADSVESAFKELNSVIKEHHKAARGVELDGRSLMQQALAENGTVILDDLTHDTGKNIQEGYRFIAAGAMVGIRNPKAHSNIDVKPERALHMLYIASLLFYKFDERI